MSSTTAAGPAAASRDERLAAVLGRAAGRFRAVTAERALFAAGAGLAVAGLVCVVVGWEGASRTVLVAGQIPYLISGGLLGLGLAFLGGFLYFAHWLALLLRQSAQSAVEERSDLGGIRDRLDQLNRTMEALAASLAAIAPAPGNSGLGGAGPSRRSERPSAAGGSGLLVATPSGTMMHRPECAAVAGRDNLRVVSAVDGLNPCGLCRPLDGPAE